MRTWLFCLQMLVVPAVWAAQESTVSKVTSNSLPEVRAAMEMFRSQVPTNAALRTFSSPLFWSAGVEETPGGSGIRLMICDCGTVSPCYELSAKRVSPQAIRIEVRSLDDSPDELRANFRPKRNARMLEELLRLLEKKP